MRGFKLIGILFANISNVARIPFNTELDIQIYRFIGFVFEQRFSPVFSFLFGLGFFSFICNAERKGLLPVRLMMRLLLLLLFGIAHQFLQPGEALLFHSILGFGLPPLYQRSPKLVFLAFSAFLFLGIFVTEYFTILAMFYLGLFVGKMGYFDKLERYCRPTQLLWLVSFLLAAPPLWLQGYFYASNSWSSWQTASLDVAAFYSHIAVAVG